MARELGVSHTQIQRIRRTFDAGKLQAEVFRRGLAIMPKFRDAQLETARLLAAGVLRQRRCFVKKTWDGRRGDALENEDYWKYRQRVDAMHERQKAAFAARNAARDTVAHEDSQPERVWDSERHCWRTDGRSHREFMDRICR